MHTHTHTLCTSSMSVLSLSLKKNIYIYTHTRYAHRVRFGAFMASGNLERFTLLLSWTVFIQRNLLLYRIEPMMCMVTVPCLDTQQNTNSCKGFGFQVSAFRDLGHLSRAKVQDLGRGVQQAFFATGNSSKLRPFLNPETRS